jgi:hypothetical protein
MEAERAQLSDEENAGALEVALRLCLRMHPCHRAPSSLLSPFAAGCCPLGAANNRRGLDPLRRLAQPWMNSWRQTASGKRRWPRA